MAKGNNNRRKSAGPWTFKRGLCDEFVSALAILTADKTSWFSEALKDNDLVIGIRDDYINVYLHGLSLFKASWNPDRDSIGVTTHPKFLIDPGLREQVALEDNSFKVPSTNPMATSYVPGKTLGRMKRAARVYRGVEKRGVQQVFRVNPDAIDLEIALSKAAADQEKLEGPLKIDDSSVARRKAAAKRLDIASFERIDGKIHLCFWEAKHYANGDLWASGDTLPPVIHQISEYSDLIDEYHEDIIKSYKTVAKNMMKIAEMSDGKRKVGELITRIANNECFVVKPIKVGVLCFGFSAADKASERHKMMLKKFEAKDVTIIARGDPSGIVLKCPAKRDH